MTDRERVLKLLEDGKITSEEAIKMLELLGSDEKEEKKKSEETGFDGFEGEFERSFAEEYRNSNHERDKHERDDKYGIYVDVSSMDIVVRTAEECETVEYRFVDADTNEIIEVPEYVDVYSAEGRLKICENFLKNFGPKMASGSFGKKVISMLGLNANDKINGVLEVYIPKNQVIREAKFSTKSGDVTLNHVNTVEKVFLSSLSGDISISNVICDKINLNTVSGDILVNTLTANTVKGNCVSGDFKMLGKIPEIDVNCVSGDIKIVNDMLLYHSRLNSVSGSIKVYVNGEEKQNYNVKGMMISKHLKGREDGEAGTSLKMSTMSGSVKLFDRSKYEGQWFDK